MLHDSTRNLVITKVETTKDDIIFVDMKEGQFVSVTTESTRRSGTDGTMTIVSAQELTSGCTHTHSGVYPRRENSCVCRAERQAVSSQPIADLAPSASWSALDEVELTSRPLPALPFALLRHPSLTPDDASLSPHRFWLNLSGPGKHPLFHLGMTGMIQLKDGEPVLYQSRSSGSDEQWPPRFWKVSRRDSIFSTWSLCFSVRSESSLTPRSHPTFHSVCDPSGACRGDEHLSSGADRLPRRPETREDPLARLASRRAASVARESLISLVLLHQFTVD